MSRGLPEGFNVDYDIPYVEPPFTQESHECKFLTVSQILCKLSPNKPLRHVWAFQKASWIFPTIIVSGQCQRHRDESFFRHRVILYFGSDLQFGWLPHAELLQLLLRHGYEAPNHLIEVLRSD